MTAKINLPQLEYSLLREILYFFHKNNEPEAWLVGGTIRDLLSHLPQIFDLDLTVNFNPVKLAQKFARQQKAGFVVLDEERQIVRIVKTIKGCHYTIDIARFRANDIDGDLKERDFTLNAMAAKLTYPFEAEGIELYDPLGGYADLNNKRLAPCSDNLFIDDPLRLMRAYRFASNYDFKISLHLQELIKRDARLLESVSAERIRDEFFKILKAEKSYAFLMQMNDSGLLENVLPELTDSIGITQNEWHHLDVFGHTLLTLENLEKQLLENSSLDWWDKFKSYLSEPISGSRNFEQALKFGCLLHDLGKPACKKIDSENNRVVFHGHEMEGVFITKKICERMKISSAEQQFLQSIVKNHMRPGVMLQQGLNDRRLFRYYSETGRNGLAIALLSLADRLSALGNMNDDELEEFKSGIFQIMNEFYIQMKKPKQAPFISGKDLIKEFNLKPGPLFKEILDKVKEAQYLKEVTSKEEALVYIKESLQQEEIG